jgi:GH25 family lysozyme M1 (1,4-beta-N-acetylmuramidase)
MSATSCHKIVHAASLTAAAVLISAVALPALPASAAVAGKHAASSSSKARAGSSRMKARTGSSRMKTGSARILRGVDVSSFQHRDGNPIDWQTLVRDGIRFAGIKVSEGTYYANPYYLSDAEAARSAGLDVLPYVFANPQAAGGAATAAFAIGAADYHYGDRTLPLAVDLENDPYSAKGKPGNCYGLRRPTMIAWIKGFVSEAKTLTGTRPIIYTTADWWRQCTGGATRFARSSLWVADYGVGTPAVPAAWQHWTLWQYSDSARLPGVGITDLDYYRR